MLLRVSAYALLIFHFSSWFRVWGFWGQYSFAHALFDIGFQSGAKVGVEMEKAQKCNNLVDLENVANF